LLSITESQALRGGAMQAPRWRQPRHSVATVTF
jgi:hypothetical protein